ncbi:MAG TPA: transketolase [Candidatus Pacebacteria bacterium]|nr:transketolase [Candidatus Paceibacterota bacterium]
MTLIQPNFTNLTQGPRDGFGAGIMVAAKQNPRVVALCSDLDESVRLATFAHNFPNQFVEVGVAEQNLVGVAAGLALGGLKPFAASYAAFNPGRNWDQLRVSVCYSNLPVTIVGGHAGLTVGGDGASHQILEDIALTRVLPNLTVIVPCDAAQAYAATLALVDHSGPAYLRLSRVDTPDLTDGLNFKIGQAQILRPGTDLTIFATGVMVAKALQAAQTLQIHNLQAQVINLHTIKPIDVTAIVRAANQSGVIVTAEEHQIYGGLGSAVAEVVTQNLGHQITQPTVIEMVAVNDCFGESGPADAVMEKYHLTTEAIVAAAEKALRRRAQL